MIKYFSLATCLILLAIGCTKTPTPTPPIPTVTIKNQSLAVEVMRTEAEREQGLSGRLSLLPDHGMLFEFGPSDNARPGFWMKDMRFAIDIIWIKNGQIVSINKNTPPPAPGAPEELLPIYSPPSDIDEVLEVNADWSDIHNIHIGDQVKLKL